MEQAITPETFALVVKDVLGAQLASAGMGEPAQVGSEACSVMWHADGWSGPRPCPPSLVWKKSTYGCYDLTVREDDGRLHVHTDTSELLDVAFPVGIDELRAHLQGIAAGIQDAIRDDFVILETKNDGYLPGAEIR